MSGRLKVASQLSQGGLASLALRLASQCKLSIKFFQFQCPRAESASNLPKTTPLKTIDLP